MFNMIQDGTGKGNLAEVDDHGRLYVKANMIGHMSHHSTYHRNAYIDTFETTLSGSSETPCVLFINSSSTKDIEVYWFQISSDSNVEVKTYVRSGYTSGGSSKSFVNTNLSTLATPGVTAYEGGASADLVVDTTDERLIHGGFIGSNNPFNFNFNGGLVITPTKSISVKATGASTNKVKIVIGFAEHSQGQKL